MGLTLTVNVTQEDIDRSIDYQHSKGVYVPACDCPIAIAIQRLGYEVRVATAGITLYDRGELVMSGFLPSEACGFIAQFDSRKPVNPFSFEVELCAI